MDNYKILTSTDVQINKQAVNLLRNLGEKIYLDTVAFEQPDYVRGGKKSQDYALVKKSGSTWGTIEENHSDYTSRESITAEDFIKKFNPTPLPDLY